MCYVGLYVQIQTLLSSTGVTPTNSPYQKKTTFSLEDTSKNVYLVRNPTKRLNSNISLYNGVVFIVHTRVPNSTDV
jgi:hypothetical protein